MTAVDAIHRFELLRCSLIRHGYPVESRTTFRNARVRLPSGQLIAEPDPYELESEPGTSFEVLYVRARDARRHNVGHLGEDAFLDIVSGRA